jgi:phosphoglycolate phosphatase
MDPGIDERPTDVNSILFDFDGTLIDTWPGIETTLRASFKALKFNVHAEAITTALVGMPLMKVFDQILEGDRYKADLALQKYRELFPLLGMAASRPFDGAAKLLKDLNEDNRSLYLVTARNEGITKKMMSDHDLTGYFKWVRGEREGEHPDGKAHMMSEVLEKFSINPLECVMVGDRRYDMEAAQVNGIRSIGVTYGYGTEDELVDAGAVMLADSIGALEKILLEES